MYRQPSLERLEILVKNTKVSCLDFRHIWVTRVSKPKKSKKSVEPKKFYGSLLFSYFAFSIGKWGLKYVVAISTASESLETSQMGLIPFNSCLEDPEA